MTSRERVDLMADALAARIMAAAPTDEALAALLTSIDAELRETLVANLTARGVAEAVASAVACLASLGYCVMSNQITRRQAADTN